MSMLKLFVSLANILSLIFLPFSIAIYVDGPKDIFILAGQSNMVGRGGVSHWLRNGVHYGKWDGFVPREAQPDPNIFRLDNNNIWVQAQEPLHADIEIGKTCGVGPGMAFANGLKSLGGSKFEVIGLVPCAVGATKMSHWSKGTALYDRLLGRAKVAVQGGGRVRALLWYQGESDTVDIEDAKLYKDRIQKFILDLRSDLNDSSIVVLQVGLASGEVRHMEIVREAQFNINLPKVRCVDAKGFDLGPDLVHLTTMSQVRLGYQLARVFLNEHGISSSFSSI